MNRKRNHQFSLRLSDSEQALWNKKQTASGLNKTEFFIPDAGHPGFFVNENPAIVAGFKKGYCR